jgi:hypothetical protein
MYSDCTHGTRTLHDAKRDTPMKLHTLEDVKNKFPVGTVTVKDIRDKALAFGTCTELGKAIVFSDADLVDFMARLSSKRVDDVQYTTDTRGLLVVLKRSLADEFNTTFVGWCPRGKELRLLERVQEFYPGKLVLQHTVGMTFGDAEQFRKRFAAQRTFGFWYRHSTPLAIAIEQLVKQEEDELNNG